MRIKCIFHVLAISSMNLLRIKLAQHFHQDCVSKSISDDRACPLAASHLKKLVLKDHWLEQINSRASYLLRIARTNIDKHVVEISGARRILASRQERNGDTGYSAGYPPFAGCRNP